MRFDATTILFMAATVLFVLSVIARIARPWMIALGLACFSAAFWLKVLIS